MNSPAPQFLRKEPLLARVDSSRSAFTLVEMLVSTSVLVLLVVLVSQLTNNATAVTTASRKHLEADAQARLVFDRMAADFTGMVKRSDVDVICKGIMTTSGSTKMAGNDAIYFYSHAPAYFDGGTSVSGTLRSNISLVGYRINSDRQSPSFGQLERLGKGLTWSGQPDSKGATNAMGFVTSLSGTSELTKSKSAGYLSAYSGTDGSMSIGSYPSFSDSKDGDFHPLAESVYRLEYTYLLNDGTYSDLPYTGLPGHTTLNGFQDVSAIVVTLAILDDTSRKLVSPNAIPSMVTTLPDSNFPDTSSSQPVLLAKTWHDKTESATFATNCGIPTAAAAQVRIYQRCFYLDQK